MFCFHIHLTGVMCSCVKFFFEELLILIMMMIIMSYLFYTGLHWPSYRWARPGPSTDQRGTVGARRTGPSFSPQCSTGRTCRSRCYASGNRRHSQFLHSRTHLKVLRVKVKNFYHLEK